MEPRFKSNETKSIHIYKAFFVYILSKEILLKLDQGNAQLHKMSLRLPKKAKQNENRRGYKE